MGAPLIDRLTGTIRFDDPVAQLSSSTTRTEFLSTPVWKPELSVRNEPHCSWKVGELRSAGRTLAVLVRFMGEQLQSVSLTVADPRFPSSWDEWSESGELARKAAHDQLLAELLGRRRSFRWGVVSSLYDQRSGGSSIIVQYGRRPQYGQRPHAKLALKASSMVPLGIGALALAELVMLKGDFAMPVAVALLLSAIVIGLRWR